MTSDAPSKPPRHHAAGRDWVAITLALGICTALNIITFAVLLDALLSEGPGLSENATQIITGAFGGILGVVGSYVGYHAGIEANTRRPEPPNTDELPSP